MFARLLDLVVEFIGLFQCFTYVNDFDKGVILRKGKYHRTVGPGLRWILPLGIEDIMVLNVRPEPMYLDVQSFETADGFAVNIQIGVIWRITDVKVFLIDNDDTGDIVAMLCCGVVTSRGQGLKWLELKEEGFPATLRAPMNRSVRKRGAEIETVVIQDFAHGSADRVWHEGISLSVEA